MKQKIGVDLDECLAEFLFSFLHSYNHRYSTAFTFLDVHTYHFEEIIGGTHEDAVNKVSEFYQTPSFRELPVVFGSRHSIRELSKKNDLVVITSRLKSLQEETERWIYHHFPGRFEEIIFSNEIFKNEKNKSKGEICSENGITAIIEDNLTYAHECAAKGVLVFLLDKSWNRRSSVHQNVHRVIDWYHLLEEVQ